MACSLSRSVSSSSESALAIAGKSRAAAEKPDSVFTTANGYATDAGPFLFMVPPPSLWKSTGLSDLTVRPFAAGRARLGKRDANRWFSELAECRYTRRLCLCWTLFAVQERSEVGQR